VPDERELRTTILQATGLDEAALLINMSHTHGGANINSQLADKPGGALIEPYLRHLIEQLSAAILEAREALAPAWVTYGTGRCALAANRDLWDAEAGRFAVGYNPDAPADDTLVVARVTGEDGGRRATLFNYACHPTTLAWKNRQLSPDFIGAAREVLESAYGVPALFLQGASGELAPRDNPSARRPLPTATAVSSDTPRQRRSRACRRPPPASSTRGSSPRERISDDPVFAMPIWAWRLGEALVVAIPNEPYAVLQTELRRRFPGVPVLVLGVTNRTMGYLSPEETYGTGLYQEQQSPFAPGCLEQTIEAATQALEKLRGTS